jgi:hypothetical protein
MFFYGISGRLAAPWGGGSPSFLCVKPPTQRTGTQNSGGTDGACDGVMTLDFLAYMASHPGSLGQPIASGQRYQTQLCDPPAPKTTNLSNGLEFDLVP